MLTPAMQSVFRLASRRIFHAFLAGPWDQEDLPKTSSIAAEPQMPRVIFDLTEQTYISKPGLAVMISV
jgi:hypothetical protein